MVQRENDESRVKSDLVLIYPLVSYQKQFWIEDNYAQEE